MAHCAKAWWRRYGRSRRAARCCKYMFLKDILHGHYYGIPHLRGARFAAEVRILHPGDMMTMDYNAARTNIMIDDKNIITTITCG